MIYIVTSGCYSDYGIDAVFQNRDKAEAYCRCHTDTEIEEWEFFDGNTYTPFNVVKISMHIRLNGTNDIYILNLKHYQKKIISLICSILILWRYILSRSESI